MINKNYLTPHPTIYKKVPVAATNQSHSRFDQINLEEFAQKLIKAELEKIKDLQFQINAYEIQEQVQMQRKIDPRLQIQAYESQILQIRRQEAIISEEITNCQVVQDKVAPLEYFLWKKKQRISTYDKAVANLCQQVERQRQNLQRQIRQLKNQSDQIYSQIDELQQKIAFMNVAPMQSFAIDNERDDDFFAKNIELRSQYENLLSTNNILQENKDIVLMQIADNVGSIEATLRNYFETEKTKLARQFKQIQQDSKQAQISPLSTEEVNYKIQPLFGDYAFKMREILNGVPQQITRKASKLLNPLPWEKFNWRDFIETQPRSQNIYTQYRKLQQECTEVDEQVRKIKKEISSVCEDIMMEQQKSAEIAQNVRKMKKSLKR